MKSEDESPLIVTILCLVYNHEAYIRQCLEGFVMQRTNFRFEAIIHDDASTDKSADIIREYAEKYPEIIKPILETQNQYSKHDGTISRIMNENTHGKYVAMCEGDDFWIDPLKLQKQVDLLEKHKDCSVCCGGYYIKNNSEETSLVCEYKANQISFKFDLKDWSQNWLTKTLTMMYRNEVLNDYPRNKYKFGRDIHICYHLLRKGAGIYLSEPLGVYNIHKGGICSMVDKSVNAIHSYNCYKEIYNFNTGEEIARILFLKSIYKRLIFWKKKDTLLLKCKLWKEGLSISKKGKEFFKLTILFLFNRLCLIYINNKK